MGYLYLLKKLKKWILCNSIKTGRKEAGDFP